MIAIEQRPWRRLEEKNPLVTALVLSFLIHLALLGVWTTGKHFGWWNHQADWLVKLTRQLSHSKPRMSALFPAKAEPPVPQEIPLSFVEVDPETVVPQPPKDAKYYSSKNSVAANPDPAEPKDIPKIEGKQTQVARVMENEKPLPFPLQPAPPKPAEEEVQSKPKGETPGDLALLKSKPPSEGTADTTGQENTPPKERIRTLAKARAARGMVAGAPMKQEGGVQRRAHIASVDAKGTAFGEYDAAFIAAVQQCWYNLIDENQITQRSGRVVLEFKLNANGRITEMQMTGNEVGELLGMLCRRAVEMPSPYPKWPAEMRSAIKATTREMRFVFYYN